MHVCTYVCLIDQGPTTGLAVVSCSTFAKDFAKYLWSKFLTKGQPPTVFTYHGIHRRGFKLLGNTPPGLLFSSASFAIFIEVLVVVHGCMHTENMLNFFL
jgi:hypothetical protein